MTATAASLVEWPHTVAIRSGKEPIMTLSITPHLNFDGAAREALDFYQAVFGGEITVLTYATMGVPHEPEQAERLVWGQVEARNGFRIMAFDVYPGQPYDRGQNPFYVSVRGGDAADVAPVWEGLSAGAEVRQDLAPTSWSPLYGMLTDRFGVTWVVDVASRTSAEN
ncbi:VOC family protein [Planctomonas psychrotolerans]|uniref:VOC family protein n=1 Tax=Planctomonas psychrotolerans TaxID=2528712 RepID=UPI0029D4146B|nr:VOC family protein [Planctomonas psychrotolerans]